MFANWKVRELPPQSNSLHAELNIMQELLRHSTIRVTLDTYTQAVTTEKRNAQDAVVALLFPQKMQGQTDQA